MKYSLWIRTVAVKHCLCTFAVVFVYASVLLDERDSLCEDRDSQSSCAVLLCGCPRLISRQRKSSSFSKLSSSKTFSSRLFWKEEEDKCWTTWHDYKSRAPIPEILALHHCAMHQKIFNQEIKWLSEYIYMITLNFFFLHCDAVTLLQ